MSEVARRMHKLTAYFDACFFVDEYYEVYQ